MAMTAYAGFDTEPYPRRLPAKSFNVAWAVFAAGA